MSEFSGDGAVSVTADAAWRVLVVDDDPDIQALTAAVLEDERFETRPIHLVSALSAAEARRILQETPDIAVALVDVAMETTTAGLDLIRTIREELGNGLVRIILRTARQDQAPARDAVTRYEIDAYCDKAATDPDYLFAVLAASLRTYRILAEMDRQRLALERTLRERDALEVQLRHAQKLEAVGRLGAGLAHEINTPVQFLGDHCHFIQSGIEDLQDLVRRQGEILEDLASGRLAADEARARCQAAAERIDLEFLRGELPQAMARSLEGIGRIGELVRSMREFSHPGGREAVPIDLNRAIASTLTVAAGELRPVADVVTELAELPPVTCFAAELNQALLNILVNAAHAIAAAKAGRGTIRVRSWPEGDRACVSVSDDGVGVPAEIRERIFDPFFTTKGVGEGTGQGLAIAYNVVVQLHGGSLQLEDAEPGTRFTLRLPVAGPPGDKP